jgi:hypothetical protein
MIKTANKVLKKISETATTNLSTRKRIKEESSQMKRRQMCFLPRKEMPQKKQILFHKSLV